MTAQKKDQITQKKPFNCELLTVKYPHESKEHRPQLLSESFRFSRVTCQGYNEARRTAQG